MFDFISRLSGGEFKTEPQLYVFIYFVGILLLLLLLLLLFFIIKLCFYYFQFFFGWSIKFPLQNINQSEAEIRDRKLSVEMYVSVHFKLKYSLRVLRRFNFIRYKKQHVRLLLLRCFCIILLNWDIRLPSLYRFHISHRKIRSNTRINTLFQLTTTRLRYHITIAVVIQATEKQFSWHKWLKNEISDYTHSTVLLHYCQNEISDCARYAVLTSLLLKWNIWLPSLPCFFHYH